MEKAIRSEESKRKFISRLNRINGQINGIKNMIEEDRYCNDVLIQMRAAINSLKNLSNDILEEHLRHCLLNKIKKGDLSVIDEIDEILKREI